MNLPPSGPEVLIDHSSHRISLPVLIALYFRVRACDLRYCRGLPDCRSLHVKGDTQPSYNLYGASTVHVEHSV